jgi:hypothetical protein
MSNDIIGLIVLALGMVGVLIGYEIIPIKRLKNK